LLAHENPLQTPKLEVIMPQTGKTPIQLYRTATAAAAPANTDLVAGELAINYDDADMALYAKNESNAVKRIMNNPAGLKYPIADGTANQVIKTDGSGTLSFLTTVTSVTGSAPVVSSGGATPAISMAAATASVNGYMTSTYATKLDGIPAGAQGSARAWVNFDGVTTVTVNSSYNVSSVTRNSTGNYTLNFTSSLSSATYAAFVTCTGYAASTGINSNVTPTGTQGLPSLKSTSQLQITMATNVNYDAGQIYAVVFNS
jgi:hypothetical protein